MPRRDEILARTDPFDLAQAIDRYVSLLPGRRIRSLVLAARDRLGPYYRGEFVRLLSGLSGDIDAPGLSGVLHETWSDEDLRSAFARLLKTNMRVIPVFGPAFCDGVLEHVPGDRTIAIGEERRGNAAAKALAATGAAAALVLAGAAGEHYVISARAQATAPVSVLVTAPPLPVPQPQQRHDVAPAPKRVIAVSPPVQTQQQPPAQHPQASRQPPPSQQPIPVPAAQPRPAKPVAASPTPPPARGVATVAIPDPTATPEPSPLDVSDMPDSYTDATPLPQVTAPPANVPSRIHLVTPTPKPAPHHKWLYRSMMHLDPFKPHPESTP